ncbi:hypothetical protein Mapa_001164 [Marchantia paleacea]|nr:hypothetical protein Mapa_001164 [Marchantia paleacea]
MVHVLKRCCLMRQETINRLRGVICLKTIRHNNSESVHTNRSCWTSLLSFQESLSPMARFRISSSSLTPCNVVLAAIMTWLSLSMVANATENRSSILNELTGNYADHEVFLQCTCVFDTYRHVDPRKILLKPGVVVPVEVDYCSGAKQVECDITRYSRAPLQSEKYYMRVVAWYFKGPSQTKFKFDNSVLYFAVEPDFKWINSALVWAYDVEYYFTPKFLSSATENVAIRMN